MWYSNKKLLAPYLELEKGGYHVYVMPTNNDTKSWTKEVRELHKTSLKKAGYEGFSNQIDDEYHLVGTYFFVVKDDAIVLTSRINYRTQSSRFPFEMGERPNGKHYIFEDNIPAVDINTYSIVFRHYRRAMPLLLAALGKHINNLAAKRAFCLVDSENSVIQRIYQNAKFVYSSQFSDPIIFPSFLNSFKKEPVKWKIMEWNQQTIEYYSELYQIISMNKS